MTDGPAANQRSTDALILDIGGDVGALVVYTGEDLIGSEIEVSRRDDPGRRVHTVVHRRQFNGVEICAGVFPALSAGGYLAWGLGGRPDIELTITGGEVVELHWDPTD